jgi:serine/threonine protein kinase
LNKPTPFGKYYLLERINVGGMAEVFKAKTVGVEGFERIVALKRILPSISEDEEFITMFIDEAKIAVQLQHANIAQIFDLGKVDDSYFIALEYVNGRDLRGIFDDLRKQGQIMPMPQVCYAIMQLCEGLDYAHNKRDAQGRDLNLVHRDVSPQNVLIGYEGEVKLIDFGIAKAAGKASKTQAGILKGKFGYMSPEQVRGLPIDRRSDIFALGIVLYEMLTGERLFIGESDFSTLEKVRNVEIVPPSSLNSEVPEKLERIVLKALEKNVEDRYQNAIDLHDDLQLFLHSIGQFSSRKDLSVWMKRTFPPIAEDEGEALDFAEAEEIEEVDAVPTASLGKTVDTVQVAASGGQSGDDDFGWDDEERETQIFDKDPAQIEKASSESSFLTDGGDKTVTGVPSEELLAEMGEAFENLVPTRPADRPAAPVADASGQGSPRQSHGGASSGATPTPLPTSFPSFSPLGQNAPRKSVGQPGAPSADAPRSPFDLPKPAFRQTLMGGMQAPTLPSPGHPAAAPRHASGVAFPTYQPAPGMPASGLPVPTFPGAAFPGAPVLSQSQQFPATVDIYTHGGLALRSPSRLKYYAAFLLFMIAGGGGAFMYMTRPGKLQIAVKPHDARLVIGGIVITEDPPFRLEKRPGVYHIAVSRDGYVPREQDVQISAGQAGHMDIELEPSPETSFDFTSQPSGGLVWLDGQPLTIDEHGKQATTNFHASRIAPGRHVLEVRGNPRFQDWRQEFFQEPGRTVRLHADLLPIAPAPKSSGSSRGGAASAAPMQIPTQPPPAIATGAVEKPAESRHHGGRRGVGSAKPAASDGDDVFETMKPGTGGKKPKPSAGVDEDIFENAKAGGGASSDTCTATLSSKPWAEVSIDGKPTGKITPLVNFPIPCGKHRITFKNSDLMIERNESITLKPGQPFKKIFSLVENEL